MNKKAQSCSHRELEYYVLCAVTGEAEGNQRDLSAAGWFSRGRCIRLTCEGSWGKRSSFVLLFWGKRELVQPWGQGRSAKRRQLGVVRPLQCTFMIMGGESVRDVLGRTL